MFTQTAKETLNLQSDGETMIDQPAISTAPPRPFKLVFRDGHISLDDQRMLLIHAGAFSALRKEMMDSLGADRTRGLLTRMGYAAGLQDFYMAHEKMPDAEPLELMEVGPRLHMLEGIVNARPVHIEIDMAEGRFFGEFEWSGSFEAEVYAQQFGVSDEPVCWHQVGYACGYTSALMGKFILFREMECAAAGNAGCRIIGKVLDDWGDNEDVKADLRYFKPDAIAEQILQLQTQVEELRHAFDERTTLGDMVGDSEAFRQSCDLIRRGAKSTVTVLLLGETGVGKEMFARGLHSVSNRADKPFLAINCAALPEQLLESELFGVEKGAFTGAHVSRPGRFERADGGTLFLDEVGELSFSAQAKLLRVLQEGEFERVGDTRVRTVDVRLVAATNVDLQEAVRTGHFRADLYYRLNIYPVRVPPLRERVEDIPYLIKRFIVKHSVRHDKEVRGVTPEAMQALQEYNWPGNIRELENMIERGVILAQHHGMIELADLFPSITIAPPSESMAPICVDSSLSLEKMVNLLIDRNTSLEELENRLLDAAVARSRGNLSCAARLLGMTRPQLAYRLKKK